MKNMMLACICLLTQQVLVTQVVHRHVKRFILVLWLLLTQQTFSQNMLANGSFENYSAFPSGAANWHFCNGWTNVNMALGLWPYGSPDYLHTSGSSIVQLPNSIFATVYPHSGSAVMGFLTWGPITLPGPVIPPEYREYLSTQFSTPMVVGKTYQVSFWVTNGTSGHESGYSSNHIGIRFSKSALHQSNHEVINVIPQIDIPQEVWNTDWQLFTFNFTADSAYKHLTIGNFYDDTSTSHSMQVASLATGAYYFIDDIAVIPAMQLNVSGNSGICSGDSTTLVAANDSVFSWASSSNPGVIISHNPSLTVAPLNTTTYFVYGSKDTVSFTVNVNYFPVINLGNDTTLCQGQGITLNANSPATSYLWSNGSTASSFYITNPGGLYWLRAGNAQCVSIDSINIRFDLAPAINANDTLLCQGQSIILTVDPVTSCLWSNGSTASSIQISSPGLYLVQAINEQCFKRDSVAVTFVSAPVIFLGNDTSLCPGQTITLNPDPANSYLWSNGSTASSIQVSSPGLYWLKAGNTQNEQCISRDSVIIRLDSLPAINVKGTTPCHGQSFTLTVGPATSCLWSNGSTASSIQVSDPGLYWVQASNPQCSNLDSISIDVYECGETEIEMPNIFTPNNDGSNDRFIPVKYKGISNATLIIFNRWGTELFSTDDPSLGWDGYYKGNTCPAGTYYWIMQYDTALDKSQKLTGFLTLIK